MPSPAHLRNTLVVTTAGEYHFAMVPDALLLDNVSDRAVRLFALLLRASRVKAYPTRIRLAVLLDCSEDSVDRALAELCANGWVEKIRQGRTKPNTYVLRPASHASDGPSIETMLRPREESDSAPMRTHDSAPMRTPIPYKRASKEVLPADSASPQDSKPKRGRIHAEPEENGGGAERVAGTEKRDPASVQHRPDSGAGMAHYFGIHAKKHFDLREFAPGQINERALAKHFKAWRGAGMDPKLIAAMIDIYCEAGRIPKRARPLWIDFLATKDRLFRTATKKITSDMDPADLFVDLPKDEGGWWES